jgi:hypothetical protein
VVEATASVLGAGAPALIGINRHPAEQGWTPPLAGPHHRLGEVSLYASNCVSLLLVATHVDTLKTKYPCIQALSQDKEQGVHPRAAT